MVMLTVVPWLMTNPFTRTVWESSPLGAMTPFVVSSTSTLYVKNQIKSNGGGVGGLAERWRS